MTNLFSSGIRPAIDEYLLAEAAKVRDYGSYWSASSAGYCQRRVIFERLKVPHSTPDDPRKQRVFSSGHIFHDWIQELTRNASISIAQEIELQDEGLMVRGHFDDLILFEFGDNKPMRHLILYDYKTQNSRAFTYQKGRPISYYHKLQLGTYMYMLRTLQKEEVKPAELDNLPELTEARILKISKDDLRMDENQLLWSPELESEVLTYWKALNTHWQDKTLPACSCEAHEGGFLAKPQYNPFYYKETPCSLEWYELNKKEGKLK